MLRKDNSQSCCKDSSQSCSKDSWQSCSKDSSQSIVPKIARSQVPKIARSHVPNLYERLSGETSRNIWLAENLACRLDAFKQKTICPF